MDKNIAIVKVGNSTGTGVIFNAVDETNTIIITCAHCISEANANEDIKIEFCKKEYKVKDYFFDEATDIAAILIEEKIELQELYIDYKFKSTNRKLNIKGYPEIVKEKHIKCLDCYLRDVNNEGNVTLKLDEKVNDTSSTTEKEKVEGFSGSPVFYKKDEKIFVIGLLNEIESSAKSEDIIYNDVKGIKIKKILDELYKKNVILYYIKMDKSIKIKWIKDIICFDDEHYKQKKILVLGGSGAGKSSFIKTFLMNNKLIDSSGDGQTTRTNIEYNISINNSEPKLECTLLTKKEFVKQRIEQIKIDLLEYCFYILLGERYDLHSEIDLPIKRILKKTLDENKKDKENSKDILDNSLLNTWCEIISEKDVENKRNKLIDLNYKYISNIIQNSQNNETGEATSEECKKNELSKQQKKELRENILLKCRGFFAHTEFNILSNDISKEIEEKFEKTFENAKISDLLENINCDEDNVKDNKSKFLIEEFFNEIYEYIHPKILNYYGKKENKFSFNLLDKDFQEKIPYLLKVKDGYSVTSMIKLINIEDKINNRYAWIMEELKLKKITLIDTCGLDHIERGETPIEVIRRAFSEKQDDIKTVIYVKKLDSGRPTELEQIIPTIYKVQSNAVVYCVLNGADILYFNHKKNDVIEFKDEKKKPNSVRYLLSKEGKEDIIESIKKKTCKNGRYIRKRRSEILYEVLTKNLVPYSSKETDNDFFINNEVHIKKLFKSIIKEEHLGGEILPDSIIKYIKESEEFEKNLIEVLNKLFKDASIVDWRTSTYGHGHHKVKKANIDRIREGTSGFDGAYDDRWNQHFKESYQNIFAMNSEENDIIKKLFCKFDKENDKEDIDNYYDKLESIFIDFKDEFLGCSCNNKIKLFPSDSYYEREKCKKCEKECFRTILKSAYKEIDLNYDLKNKRDYEFLNIVCNFEERFKDDKEIQKKFVNYFRKRLEVKINIDKDESLNRILRINPEIENDFDLLKEKIGECFWGSDKLDDKLFDRVIEKLRKKEF